MIQLYGHATPTAANIIKIRAALFEAGVAHGYVPVDLAGGGQKHPEFLALNPHGKVPVFVDGSFCLPESDAILWYVAEKYPAAKLLPQDIEGRARVHQWCDFASTSIYTASYEIHIHTNWAPPESRSAFVAERGRAALDRGLAVLEQHLQGRQFVATDALTIADYAVVGVLHMLRTRSHADLTAYPNISAFADRIAQRPAWQKALAPLA